MRPASLLALAAILLPAALRADKPGPVADVVLAVHGGAGVVPRARMTPELEKRYTAVLRQALEAGGRALRRDGGAGVDAVEAAIRVMEDSPLFNAGKGAVFTHDGRNELDASIMEGKERRAGAVAGVTILKNPISAARAVMEKSEHVLLTGRGAELFATRQGLEIVDPSYFWTKERWQQLEEALRKDKGARGPGRRPGDRFGTVGAVARDRRGNLAAGTSTGGMTNKRFGRVGDSPIIGAGTYADNATCAVSATGHGEVFIRFAVAHDIAARMAYQQLPVHEAARRVIAGLPREEGGAGGVIALDAAGNLGFAFDTEGMYRGYLTADGRTHVAVYGK